LLRFVFLVGLLIATCASSIAAPTLVLTRVHVVDIATGKSASDRAVIMRSGRITWIGPRSAVRVPAGAVRVDGHGGYLIPGLWDMHVHFVQDTTTLRAYLAAGVTGVRDMGGAIDTTLRLREEIASGKRLGPEIVTAGLLIDGPKPGLPWRLTAADSVGARDAVDSLAKRGVDFIKVHNGLSRPAYFAVAARAREVGLPFTGHVPFGVSPTEAIEAGQASLEHTTALMEVVIPREAARSVDGFEAAILSFERDQAPALYREMARRGVWFTPTLVAARGSWQRFVADSTIRRDPTVAASIRAWWADVYPIPQNVPDGLVRGRKLAFERSLHLVHEMHEAHVHLLAGTDVGAFGVLPGASLHEELELLVEAGLPPAEALATATLEPARFLGREGDAGRIAVGQRADLVLLRQNPLEQISAVRGVVGVVRAGQWIPI